MHIAMRLLRNIQTQDGSEVCLSVPAEGQIGMLPVFDTAEAARAVYGKTCETVEVFPEEKK